jgi:phage shock protein PspC (stress-responsive transcriptional regulator)
MNNLVRPRNGAVIAGVCAALGNRFGLSANIVRLIAVLSVFLPGPQVIAYIILWILIPKEA